MRYAIIFAFAALAFLAQANARSVVTESVDRGAIVQVLKKKLAQAKEKLGELIHYAHDQLKAKIAQAQKLAEIMIDELSQEAIETTDHYYKAAQIILEVADYLEDIVVESAKYIINKYDRKHSKEHVTVGDRDQVLID